MGTFKNGKMTSGFKTYMNSQGKEMTDTITGGLVVDSSKNMKTADDWEEFEKKLKRKTACCILI